MSHEDDLAAKYDLEHWPHQFTRNGPDELIGEDRDAEGNVTGKRFAVPMICVHCSIAFLNGKDQRPPEPCPARNRKREMKRILG